MQKGRELSFLIMSGQRAWRCGAEGSRPEEVQSPFIQDYIERRERQGQFRAWRTGGDGDYASELGRTMTWGRQGRPIAAVEVQYLDAAPDGQGGFYYAVGFGPVGGLFHQNASGEERRLFHREKFTCEGLAFQATSRQFVAALGSEHGMTHLVLLDENGRQTRRLTEGDCNDARPAWDPTRPGRVLYQSSGMARRSDGWAEHGAWEAMELNLEKGEITPLWSREGMDVLLPRRDRRGRLYALIRPSRGAPLSLAEYGRRLALMPVIFAQAVFGFANAFTYMFARKPLWKAGGPAEKVEVAPTIRILGRQLETKALQERGGKNAAARSALAPESWQLWRRDPDGSEHKIANSVSWFALDDNDTPHYTTGLAIHAHRDGNEETVYEGSLVESFVPLR